MKYLIYLLFATLTIGITSSINSFSKEAVDIALLQKKPSTNSLSGLIDLPDKKIDKYVDFTDSPSSKTLKIDISKLKIKTGTIILFNPQLKSIFKKKFKNNSVFEYKYKKMRTGAYLLKIKTEDGTLSMKYEHKAKKG